MKDLWNEICFDLSECKRRNVLEKDYENAIVQCLAILGWKKYLGEMTTQYPIQVGHETKLADIVVSSGGTEQFVIEVKRPGHTICPEDERQMFSYMRLLKHQVMFGLYIGDDIRLYYDDRSSQSFPEPLFIVNISINWQKHLISCVRVELLCIVMFLNHSHEQFKCYQTEHIHWFNWMLMLVMSCLVSKQVN